MMEEERTSFPEPDGFGEALQRLEEVAEALENGELPLEEAMDHYEEGLFLIRFCERRLEEAELLVEEVDDSDPDAPRLQDKEPPEA